MGLEADSVVQFLLPLRQRLLALAVAVVRDVHAADDIFQQVMLAALEARTGFRDSEHMIAWSRRAVRHRAIDLARKRRLQSLPDEVLDLLEAPSEGPAGPSWSDRAEALHRCLGGLADAARELLRMKHAEGLTTPMIAARLRRTPAAVVQHLCRIHRALRKCVERKLRPAETPPTPERPT